MFIETETTPYPARLKFLPGRPVMETGTADFTDVNDARRSPLATALFGVEGITRVFLGSDFITVTKSDDKDWDIMKTWILGTIMDHFLSGQPVITGSAAATDPAEPGGEDPIGAQIKDLDRYPHPGQRLPRTVVTSLSAASRMGWSTWNSTGPRRAS